MAPILHVVRQQGLFFKIVHDTLFKWQRGFWGAPILFAEATTMHDRIPAALQTAYNYLVVEANNSITIQAVQDHIHSPL